MDLKLLKKLGMDAKEVKLYVKLLELGICSAGVLAKRTESIRTSTYSLLNSMINKGYVSFITKKGVKYYSAIDPRVLIDHYFDGAKALKILLPELLAISNAHGQKPKITFYEGVEGIKQICETLLEVPMSTRLSFMGIDERKIHPEIKRYFEEDFINRRVELQIKYKGIVTGYIPMGNLHKPTEEGQNRELKFVDPDKFPIQIQIDIFPRNKVVLYSYNRDEMMGVIIEHEAFYNTMKTAFNLAWAGA